jgi:hybrid cluster-associated redox disulfide protein
MTVADMALADLKLAELTMAELMSGRPAVVPVLLRRGLACPGCAMAPFMTVREAAEAYGLELDALLDDLAAADGQTAFSTEIR